MHAAYKGRGGVIRDNQKPTKDYPRPPSPFPRAIIASFSELGQNISQRESLADVRIISG
jgi:hypothetical protein